MVNEQLLDYIKSQLEDGVSKEDIKGTLLENGWTDADVGEAFLGFGSTSTAPDPVPSTMEALSPQSPSSEKKNKWWIVFVVLGVVILLTIGAVVYKFSFSGKDASSLATKDIPSVDDSDLRLKIITVADIDNAYFDLIKLKKIMYLPREKISSISDMATGKFWDDLLAEDIISKNTQAFEYFAEAAGKPKFQDPASANPVDITPDTVLPSVSAWRNMALLSAVKALYLEKQGKHKEALDESLVSVRVGQKIQESQSPLIEYITATTMKGIGLGVAQRIVSSSVLGGDELRPYLQELNQFYNNEDGLISALKGDYYAIFVGIDWTAGLNEEEAGMVASVMSKEGVEQEVVKKIIEDDYYFQPNKTKALFADYARREIEMTVKPCSEVSRIEIPRLVSWDSPEELYKTENAVGKIIHDTVGMSHFKIIIKKCEDIMMVAGTQALFAVKAFYNDKGEYPVSLEELVPEYLSSVPKDPFDDKDIKYLKEKKILYSIGKDLKDNGGSTGDDWRRMPDPTFKIDF